MRLKHSWTLTERQICDCELILDGSFSPLNRFMTENDYKSVINNMRLPDGSLFSIPITLDVTERFSKNLKIGDEIFLREKEGFQIASMLMVESIWEPDKKEEVLKVYATEDSMHPAVQYIFNISNKINIGGKLKKINLPKHYDFTDC